MNSVACNYFCQDVHCQGSPTFKYVISTYILTYYVGTLYIYRLPDQKIEPIFFILLITEVCFDEFRVDNCCVKWVASSELLVFFNWLLSSSSLFTLKYNHQLNNTRSLSSPLKISLGVFNVKFSSWEDQLFWHPRPALQSPLL